MDWPGGVHQLIHPGLLESTNSIQSQPYKDSGPMCDAPTCSFVNGQGVLLLRLNVKVLTFNITSYGGILPIDNTVAWGHFITIFPCADNNVMMYDQLVKMWPGENNIQISLSWLQQLVEIHQHPLNNRATVWCPIKRFSACLQFQEISQFGMIIWWFSIYLLQILVFYRSGGNRGMRII